MNRWLKGANTGGRWRRVATGVLAGAMTCTMHLAVAALITNGMPSPAVAREQSVNTTCALKPLTLPLFDATPPNEEQGVSASPEASPASLASRPASPQDAAAVEDGLGIIKACINTGNPLLVYAVFSTRYLAARYADPHLAYLPAFEEQLDGPTIPVDPPFSFDPVEDVRMLADGRVQVTLTVHRGAESWTDTLVLVKQEGAWLIDDVIS